MILFDETMKKEKSITPQTLNSQKNNEIDKGTMGRLES